MITLHELDCEQEYETEISQCVRVTGYHHWFFLKAMAEALNLKFRAFAVYSSGERLGVVPLLFRRRGPVSTVNYLPLGSLGPLITGDALRERRMRELVGAMKPVLRRHQTVTTHWAFSPGLNVSAEQLAMPGFEIFESESYVIPSTKSADECLKSMSRVRRQSIRQSERHGLFVADSSIEEITKWLPRQMVESYRRREILPGCKLSETQSLTERLATHPRMFWRTVKAEDGSALAISGGVIGEERLWGWLMVGTSVPGVSAASLCYWDLIKWSLARGLAYDLGGAPSEGTRKFKISVGADVETCITAIHSRPRIVYKSGRALYNWTMARRAMWEVNRA